MMVLGSIRGTLAICLVLLGTAVLSFGRNKELRGRILAYDPIFHIAKMASFVENQEIVILQAESKGRQSYVKLILHGFGQVQIPDTYFAGESALTIRASRDTSCDQKAVEFVSESDIPQLMKQPEGTLATPLNLHSGRFLLSSSFIRGRPSPALSNLKCYSARITKEQQ